MSISIPSEFLSDIIRARDTESWLSAAAEIVVRVCRPRRVIFAVRTRQGLYVPQPIEWRDESLSAAPASIIRPLLREVFEERRLRGFRDLSSGANDSGGVAFLDPLGHETLLVAFGSLGDDSQFGIVLFDSMEMDRENVNELLNLLVDLHSLVSANKNAALTPPPAHRYERLVEHSDAILFNTDAEQHVQFISRRALDFFGLAPEEFISAKTLKWIDLLYPEDGARIRLHLNRQKLNPHPLDEEVRVINRVTGRLRWILVRLVPILAKEGQVIGWDGFGIDISSRKDAQSALDAQSKKIRALYTVASAIRGYLEPGNIAIRGLAALCDATGAHSGICYLYPPRNESPKGIEELDYLEPPSVSLESIARYGFPEQLDEGLLTSLAALSAHVAETNQSLVVPDLCSDPRAGMGLVTQDLLRSAVLVPVAVEDEVLGVVGLFSNELSRFDGSSVMLVSAAANQIGLAARQANLFSLYKRQTKYLSALYRMSHELSRHLQPEPLYQNAFSIIRDEMGLKRLWLGMLNESGTRLIGQAAYGPGWRRRLIDVSVDVLRADHALGRVVVTKKPMLIRRSDELLKEFGVKRLFSRMSISAVALVPIVSGEDILGVLAVQPGVNDPNFQRDQLHLLMSLAAEIGVSIQTQRFATKMREGEKMRASSVLAAGIAHNFNNSLQAILGQASLLEMQSSNPDRVKRAAIVINEAATKSASLVRQLLAFTQIEEPKKEVLDVRDFLERSRESLQRVISAKNRLHFEFSDALPEVYFDPGQLSRIISALVHNSFEAMPEGGEIFIRVDKVVFEEERTVLEVPPGNYIRLTLRDTGRGMTEEALKRCFEPFFTTKNVDPGSGLGLSGSGLGLSTAYTLMRRNGGRILVESQLGAGTTFTLYLPVHLKESELVVEKLRTDEGVKPKKVQESVEVRSVSRV